MAKIGSYENAPSPVSAEDKLIGTDSVNNDATKNFTVQEITDFAESQIIPYKKYVALLDQLGSTIPTAIVLENTTGVNFTFSRTGVGNYFINSPTSIFDEDTTFIMIAQSENVSEEGVSYLVLADVYSTQSINIRTKECTSVAYNDGILYKTSIEIRIY